MYFIFSIIKNPFNHHYFKNRSSLCYFFASAVNRTISTNSAHSTSLNLKWWPPIWSVFLDGEFQDSMDSYGTQGIAVRILLVMRPITPPRQLWQYSHRRKPGCHMLGVLKICLNCGLNVFTKRITHSNRWAVAPSFSIVLL